MKNLDDFINYMFPPVEDKPGYVWINRRNHEIAKVDLIKENIENFYEQYRILQENLESNNTKEVRIPLCKGLQADMVIIDEFLTEVYNHFLNNYTRADVIAIHSALCNAEPRIIKCKDCKYLQKLRFPEQVIKKYGQIYECSLDAMPDPTPDDYCSRAERKEERKEDNLWCNTCKFKHLESECFGCAEYDEYDNLIELHNYEKEYDK